MSLKILFNDFVILALKTDQKEKTQVISKDVIIDDKLTININVQKKLGSELVEKSSETLEENISEPPGEDTDSKLSEVKTFELPSTPRSTPNSNDDLLQQQAADMIEQVISAASQKVEIELPELLTDNIIQLNRNHSSEKLEAPEETQAEPEAEDESLSAATSTETVVENETSTKKGKFVLNRQFTII